MSYKAQLDNIHYISEGSGEPIIFIHGVGLDHTIFKKQINYFSKDFRVIAYDMLGHGKSEKPNINYQLSYYVEQLNRLIIDLNLKNPHIVGFSMGAMVAQLFAIKYPYKLKKLCLLNAVAKRNPKQQKGVLSRVEQVKKEGHHSTIDSALKRWFTEKYFTKHPDVIENIRTILSNNPFDAYLESYTLFSVSDKMLWPKLDKIKAPTLIITGEKDTGSTPEMSLMLGKKIQHSEVAILPNIKHMAPIEASESVNNIIENFLRKEH